MRRLLLASLLVLAGCPVGPSFVRPAAPDVQAYTPGPPLRQLPSAQGLSQGMAEGRRIEADWWRVFGNARVNALVEEALAHNEDLHAAQATLRQSQALLNAGYGVFIPEIDGTAAVSRETSNLQRFGTSIGSTVFNLFSLSASVNYALDIWGGERRYVESLEAERDLQRHNVAATQIMLSGNVVTTAIAEAAWREQVRATEALIRLEQEQVDVTKAQAEGGTTAYSNVLPLQTQLAGTVATLGPLRLRAQQSAHLLAVLTGRPPAEATTAETSLTDFTVPPELPLSLPSELVRQRPDILMAEERLHDANAQIGVRTAALFPSLVLSPAVGVNSQDLAKLFDPASFFWSLAASLTGPIFDGARRWNERSAAVEAREAAAGSYRQVVLNAFEQVADTLRALEHDADTVAASSDAVAAATDALKLTQINYQSGVASYLQVLIANEQLHQATLRFILARAQRLQDTAALYVALGGGWWNGKEASASAKTP